MSLHGVLCVCEVLQSVDAAVSDAMHIFVDRRSEAMATIVAVVGGIVVLAALRLAWNDRKPKARRLRERLRHTLYLERGTLSEDHTRFLWGIACIGSLVRRRRASRRRLDKAAASVGAGAGAGAGVGAGAAGGRGQAKPRPSGATAHSALKQFRSSRRLPPPKRRLRWRDCSRTFRGSAYEFLNVLLRRHPLVAVLAAPPDRQLLLSRTQMLVVAACQVAVCTAMPAVYYALAPGAMGIASASSPGFLALQAALISVPFLILLPSAFGAANNLTSSTVALRSDAGMEMDRLVGRVRSRAKHKQRQRRQSAVVTGIGSYVQPFTREAGGASGAMSPFVAPSTSGGGRSEHRPAEVARSNSRYALEALRPELRAQLPGAHASAKHLNVRDLDAGMQWRGVRQLCVCNHVGSDVS